MTVPALVGATTTAVAIQGGRFAKLRSLIKFGSLARFLGSVAIFEGAQYGIQKLFSAFDGGEASSLSEIPGVMPLCERHTEKMFHEHFRNIKTALGERQAMSLVVLMRMLATCPPGVVKVGEDDFMNQIIAGVDAQVASSWHNLSHGEGSSFTDYLSAIEDIAGKLEGPVSSVPGETGPNASKAQITPFPRVKSVLEKDLMHDPSKLNELRNNESGLMDLWNSIKTNLISFHNTAVSAQSGQEIRLTEAGLLPFEALEYSKFIERLGLGNPQGVVTPEVTKTSDGTYQTVSLQPTNILNLLLGVYAQKDPAKFVWKTDTAKHLATAAHAYLVANDGLSSDLGIVLKGQTHKSGTKSIKLLVNSAFGFDNSRHHAYVKAGVLTSARRDEVYSAFKLRLTDVEAGKVKAPTVNDINGGRNL